MSDIYNKNAREAHLMAEAYTNIYKEGQFYGRDDLVKRYKDKEKGHRKFEGPEGSGMRVSMPPGKEKDIEDLIARGYTEIEDNSEDAEYETEAHAYRDRADKYRAADSIEVGNIYKGESYHELVVGVKGDEVFTKKITLEDGNRYDANRMLDEVKLAGKLNIDFLNEVL